IIKPYRTTTRCPYTEERTCQAGFACAAWSHNGQATAGRQAKTQVANGQLLATRWGQQQVFHLYFSARSGEWHARGFGGDLLQQSIEPLILAPCCNHAFPGTNELIDRGQRASEQYRTGDHHAGADLLIDDQVGT